MVNEAFSLYGGFTETSKISHYSASNCDTSDLLLSIFANLLFGGTNPKVESNNPVSLL